MNLHWHNCTYKNDIHGIKSIIYFFNTKNFRSQFEYIDGAGHWVHSQKPKEFLEVLIRFLKDVA